MSKLLKGLMIVMLLLIVIAAVGLFVVASNLGSIIKSGVNDYGPQVLGVPVSLSSADISLLDGKASLGGLAIANPDGFSDGNAFELETINLALDLASLQKPVIVIDSISIAGATINAEQVGSTTNLQVLKNRISKASSGGSSSSSSQSEQSSPTKIAIANFEFIDASASVTSQQLGEQSVEIPSVRLQNIGTPEQGITPESAAQAIMQPLMKTVIAEVQKQALDQVVDKEIDRALDKALGDKAGKYKDKIKGLFK